MDIKVKKVNDYTRELDIDISWEEVQPDFHKTTKNLWALILFCFELFPIGEVTLHEIICYFF